MRSFFQKKLWIALLAVLALGALTALAISLDDVSFSAAQRFAPGETASIPPMSAQDITRVRVEIPWWKQLVVWALVLFMMVLIGLLLSPELRKRLLVLFVRTSLIVLATIFLLQNYGDRLFGLSSPAGNLARPEDAANLEPMPQFQPPQFSPVVSYLVSFAFALLWIAVIWAVYRGWQRYNSLNPRKSLDEIALIARSSLNDLNAGRDSSDVIINCYLRMNDVVADKRRLYREIAVTPNEFALRLERAGLPGEAVRRLTRLFEAVRYGERKSAPKDVSEAVSCLSTILHYCGESV
jgi:hypothetical protein